MAYEAGARMETGFIAPARRFYFGHSNNHVDWVPFMDRFFIAAIEWLAEGAPRKRPI